MFKFATFFLLIFLLPVNPTSAAQSTQVTKVLIKKGDRQLSLLRGKKIIKTYKVALGSNPKGHKTQDGDGKTPEGTYTINFRNPNSRFHRSLHISYPNAIDKKRAKENKVSPGGEIYIHGLGREFKYLGPAHTMYDWTLGCIAVTNNEIEEIWKLVPNGTVVEIKP